MTGPVFVDLPTGCPPPQAAPAAGAVFRAANHDPPEAVDFLSLYEEERPLRNPTPVLECQHRGLSVFRALADVRHLLGLFPDRWQLVAAGVLTADSGVTLHTPSNRFPSHTTWWCYAGIERQRGFVIIE